MKKATFALAGPTLLGCLLLAGCHSAPKTVDEAAAAPPKTPIVNEPDLNVVKVERPERFALVTAEKRMDRPEIHATGSVSPDVERSIPVVSLAAGRVVEIHGKLGDDVEKGQLLLKVLSNDISNATQTYQQAKADEALARKQLDRAKLLYEHGAVSLNELQVAEGAEEKAKVSLAAAAQFLRTLGGDPDSGAAIISINAPESGTIVEQNVVLSATVRTDSQQPLFTIADLSRVWVLCDVYENDLPSVKMGDIADVQLNAYPDRTLHGRISNIGKVLDTNLRTAKVRIEMANPGIMRSGMFVTAIFYGQQGRSYARVPSSAIIHLHDRDWVFVPDGNGQFRRHEITGGKITGNDQEVIAGLKPGDKVVANALELNGESAQ
jgi:cobalt-zinc-cadmium efflux system membrane fusion protein